MKDELDLKALWKRQQLDTPDPATLLAKAKSVKKQIRNKAIVLVFVLLATAAVVAFVWFTANFKMLTTKAGVSLVILAIAITIANQLKLVLFAKRRDTGSAKEYLAYLIAVKQQQEYTSRVIMSIYFLLLSVGVGLYMYEPLSKIAVPYMLLGYAVTFGFFLFIWIYVRPRKIKVQQRQIGEIIRQLQKYETQFGED